MNTPRNDTNVGAGDNASGRQGGPVRLPGGDNNSTWPRGVELADRICLRALTRDLEDLIDRHVLLLRIRVTTDADRAEFLTGIYRDIFDVQELPELQDVFAELHEKHNEMENVERMVVGSGRLLPEGHVPAVQQANRHVEAQSEVSRQENPELAAQHQNSPRLRTRYPQN
ncbi:hypothetical protein UCRPC4_g01458 [Phaeomoniella chlamydospora]|uniref:Uncharacterized protein n=1 Tax=Phaeomoniella chlamydospora TaxID=158046 RepID=A0A0G2EW59_PHACM|nr:hypothetical protein UCRPC4_g01458 [Phaeomoniella chlamydospora]